MKSRREFLHGCECRTLGNLVRTGRAGGRCQQKQRNRAVITPIHSKAALQKSPGKKRGFPENPLAKSPSRPVISDRKSTRLNSSHANISYAVFCLKKKNWK